MKQNKPFRCQLWLEGSSVLDGIRQMVEAGVTDAVLPNYLANVKTLCRNKILIRPKAVATGGGG